MMFTAADVDRLEANVDRILRRAEGYPVEVVVGKLSFVASTRRDFASLILSLRERLHSS